MKVIEIDKDFSPFAAGRYKSDGPWSGERFLEEILLPAMQNDTEVCVKLDGTLGLGSSFLEEAFGGLVRKGYRLSDLKGRLQITGRKKNYVNRAWKYIEDEDRKLGALEQ